MAYVRSTIRSLLGYAMGSATLGPCVCACVGLNTRLLSVSVRMSPMPMTTPTDPLPDLTAFAAGRRFGTVLADPTWQSQNRTGKVAPEHRRLARATRR